MCRRESRGRNGDDSLARLRCVSLCRYVAAAHGVLAAAYEGLDQKKGSLSSVRKHADTLSISSHGFIPK